MKDNQTRFREITEAINTGDIKLAHRLAHTLSSNAGHLGKTLLQQAAMNIEQHLKNDKSLVTKEELKIFETELNAALAQLAVEFEAITRKKADEPKEWLDVKSTLELFAKLEHELKKGDPGCILFIDDLGRVPGSEQLIQEVEDFDFDKALLSLTELKKGFE